MLLFLQLFRKKDESEQEDPDAEDGFEEVAMDEGPEEEGEALRQAQEEPAVEPDAEGEEVDTRQGMPTRGPAVNLVTATVHQRPADPSVPEVSTANHYY